MAEPAEIPLRRHIVRFVAVGIVNTLLDLCIYTVLRSHHFSIVEANLCSTTVALTFSFILNRHYTFTAHGRELKRQLLRFFPVTVVGLWALQPTFIYLLTKLDKVVHYSQPFPGTLHPGIILPKLGATVVSLAWNFMWYRSYVFAD